MDGAVRFNVRAIERDNEFAAQVEFTNSSPSTLTYFHLARSRGRKGADTTSGRRLKYHVADCHRITMRATVEREHQMMIHFDNSRLMIRAWPREADRNAMILWEALSDAVRARKTQLRLSAPTAQVSGSAERDNATHTPPSSSRIRRVLKPASVPRSQGRRMQRAIARASPTTARMATPRRDTLAASLVGAPPRFDDLTPKKPRVRTMMKKSGREREASRKAAVSRPRGKPRDSRSPGSLAQNYPEAQKQRLHVTSVVGKHSRDKPIIESPNNPSKVPAGSKKPEANITATFETPQKQRDPSSGVSGFRSTPECISIPSTPVPYPDPGNQVTQASLGRVDNKNLLDHSDEKPMGVHYKNPWLGLEGKLVNHLNTSSLPRASEDANKDAAEIMASLGDADHSDLHLKPTVRDNIVETPPISDPNSPNHRTPHVSPKLSEPSHGGPHLGDGFATPTTSELMVIDWEGNASDPINASPPRNRHSPESLGQHSSDSSDRQYHGIPNSGNSCYLACVLQVLFTDTAFVQSLKKRFIALGGPDKSRPLVTTILQLIDGQKSGHTLSAEDIRIQFGKYMPSFANKDEQDAHEFIFNMLSLIEQELGNDPLKCPVNESFAMVEQKLAQCNTCGKKSTPRHELLRYLTLSLPDEAPSDSDTHNLADFVTTYYAPETVERTCETCKGEIATLSCEVAMAPRALIVHLNRVRVSKNYWLIKNIDKVEIPREISLSSVKGTWNSVEGMLDDLSSSSVPSRSSCKAPKRSSPDGTESMIESAICGNKRIGTSTGIETLTPRKRPRHQVVAQSRPASKILGPGGQVRVDTNKVHTPDEKKVNKVLSEGVIQEEAEKAVPNAMEIERSESPSEQLTRMTSAWVSCQQSNACNTVEYSLHAIIRHRGTPESGHYIADIVQENGEFLSFNDASIYPLSEEGAERQPTDSYLMYYVKK